MNTDSAARARSIRHLNFIRPHCVYQTTLWHLGSELPWDFRVGPGTDSEQRHLDEMLPTLPPGSMLTADANFISFDLCAALARQRVHFLLRVASNRVLLTELGGEQEVVGQTVYLWPQKRRDEAPVKLRIIVISTEKSPIYLLKDLHDTAQLSDAATAALYRRRWGGEIYYHTVKRKFPFAKLASRSHHHALIEQRAMLISLWLLQLISVAARAETRQPVRRWSGALARRLIRRWLRTALTSPVSPNPTTTLLPELAHAVIDSYQRSGPKHRTHCPRQKTESPPSPPKHRPATRAERARAKRFWLQSLPKL